MSTKIKLFLIRLVGVTCSMLGIGGIAGWTESGNGFWLSVGLLAIGIILLWTDWRVDEDGRFSDL